MRDLVASEAPPAERVEKVQRLYQEAGIFDKAHLLVDKYQERAERIADETEPESLRRLLYYLIDTVLERPAEAGAGGSDAEACQVNPPP